MSLPTQLSLSVSVSLSLLIGHGAHALPPAPFVHYPKLVGVLSTEVKEIPGSVTLLPAAVMIRVGPGVEM